MGHKNSYQAVESQVHEAESQIKKLYSQSKNMHALELMTYMEALSHIDQKKREALSCLKALGESRYSSGHEQSCTVRQFQQAWNCLRELIESVEFYYSRTA